MVTISMALAFSTSFTPIGGKERGWVGMEQKRLLKDIFYELTQIGRIHKIRAHLGVRMAVAPGFEKVHQ